VLEGSRHAAVDGDCVVKALRSSANALPLYHTVFPFSDAARRRGSEHRSRPRFLRRHRWRCRVRRWCMDCLRAFAAHITDAARRAAAFA
jgi:hypothetical protein